MNLTTYPHGEYTVEYRTPVTSDQRAAVAQVINRMLDECRASRKSHAKRADVVAT